MDQQPLQGLMYIKNGKVTLLKNVSDNYAAIIGAGDPVQVLKTLSDEGWKLGGDYELRIYKE